MGKKYTPKPWFMVLYCLRSDAEDRIDGVRHPIDGSDHWEAFETYAEARQCYDERYARDDTYTVSLGLTLNLEAMDYDHAPKPINYRQGFWQRLKAQINA
tara:strand:+ start:356 stop:655 length:300 start_codon:yes stop_codon:yes gene_type:complete